MTEPSALPERRRFSRVHVLEGAAATILAAAIVGTAGGMSWLIAQLPSRLYTLEEQIKRILENQHEFNQKFDNLESQVQEHDRRIIRLELR